MKYLIIVVILMLCSCSARQINGRPQTFAEYVVLNKYSDYKGGKSVIDWKTQPSDNYPGLRLIKWFKSNEVENMQKFITIEEYNSLDDKLKEKYEIIYLDPETKCIPYGYQLKS